MATTNVLSIATTQTLKDVNLMSGVVLSVADLSIEQELDANTGVKTGSINGVDLYAPKTAEIEAATSEKIGGVKVDADASQMGDHEYALKIKDNDYAYVKVPWTDAFVTSAWYDSTTKQICLSVGGSTLSVNVGDLVDTYTGDNETISVANNTFSVKSGVYAKNIDNVTCDFDMKLGEYLSSIYTNLKFSSSVSETPNA